MTTLKHDAQGFLVGDYIDVKPSMALLADIRDEIRSLRTSITAGIKFKSTAITSNSARATPSRDNQGRFTKATEIVAPSRDKQAQFVQKSVNKPVSPAGRKANESNSAKNTPSSSSNPPVNLSNSSRALLNGLPGRIGQAVEMAGSGLKDSDPTIQAASEAVSPLATGYRTLFGSRYSQNNDTPWYKRIFRELRLIRKDESIYSKAELKAIKKLEDKPTIAGNGATGSFLSGFLGGLIPVLGAGLVAGFGVIFNPIGLAIVGAATAAWGTFTDSGKAFFAGVADRIYQGWTETTGYLTSTWDQGLTVFSELWQPIADRFNESLNKFNEIWQSIAGYFKDKLGNVAGTANKAIKTSTGVDVKAQHERAIDYTSRNIIEPTAKNTKSIIDKTTDFVSRNVIERGANAIEAVKQRYSEYANADMGNPGGKRIGGSRSWRNNNPGNIEYGDFARSLGATGSDGRFAIFPDYASGRKAMGKLIFEGKSYKNKTLTEAISRYAPGFENDTRKYQNTILKSVGGVNKPMSQYSQDERDAILDAMQRHEGFKPGRIVGNKSGGTVASTPNVLRLSIVDNKPTMAATAQTSPFVSSSAPTIAQLPTIADPEPVFNPLSSRVQRGSGMRLDMNGLVTQDVSDARIAHLLSGGYTH